MTTSSRLVAVAGLLGASLAFACNRPGAHGHVGAVAFPFAFGFSVHTHAYPPPLPQPVYVQPQPIVVQPVPVMPPPPMVQAAPVAVAPVVIVQPPPQQPVAQVVQRPPEPPAPPSPPFLAVKWMPGVSSVVAGGQSLVVGQPAFAHSPGLELRVNRWFTVRADAEFRQNGRSWDFIGAKLQPFPGSPVRPYASGSLSVSETPNAPVSFGATGAVGLDLYLSRNFFIEAEARYRVVPGCCGDEHRLAGVIGAGVAFF